LTQTINSASLARISVSADPRGPRRLEQRLNLRRHQARFEKMPRLNSETLLHDDLCELQQGYHKQEPAERHRVEQQRHVAPAPPGVTAKEGEQDQRHPGHENKQHNLEQPPVQGRGLEPQAPGQVDRRATPYEREVVGIRIM